MKKNRKKKKRFKLFKFLLFLVIVGIGIFSWVTIKDVKAHLDIMYREDIENVELYRSSKPRSDHFDRSIENIAILGIDVEDEDTQRSDVIMIASIDRINETVLITSILRDTVVYIPEYGLGKINAAYSYGGASHAVATLNYNFDLDIENYVCLNFEVLVDVIDAIGGIPLELSGEEIEELNRILGTMYDYQKEEDFEYVDEYTSEFNGYQVLAYSRIRNLGNSDFDRTKRQRIVIERVAEKIKFDLDYELFENLLGAMSDNIQTSLTDREIINLAYNGYKSLDNLQMSALSDNEHIRSAEYDGMMCLIPYNLSDLMINLHTKIYGSDCCSIGQNVVDAQLAIENEIGYDSLSEIYTGSTF